MFNSTLVVESQLSIYSNTPPINNILKPRETKPHTRSGEALGVGVRWIDDFCAKGINTVNLNLNSNRHYFISTPLAKFHFLFIVTPSHINIILKVTPTRIPIPWVQTAGQDIGMLLPLVFFFHFIFFLSLHPAPGPLRVGVNLFLLWHKPRPTSAFSKVARMSGKIIP